MTLSLNETFKLVKDAARGSDLTWGEADELARVAVWLEVAGQNGAACAIDVINGLVDGNLAVTSLHRETHWVLSPPDSSPVKAISALTAGITARDLLVAERDSAAQEARIAVHAVRAPIVALGLLASIAPPSGSELIVTVTTDEKEPAQTLIRRGSDVFLSGVPGEGTHHIDAAVTSITDDAALPADTLIWSPDRHQTALENGVAPSADTLATLTKMAHNCLVPATEESRLKGAGAGTVDRD